MSERSGGFGAFLFGIVLGAVAGFVFAPTEGGESTRRKVTKGLRNLKELAEEKVDEVRGLLKETEDEAEQSDETDEDDDEEPEIATREQLRRRLEAARRRPALGSPRVRRGGRAARVNREGGWHRTVTGVVRRTLEAAYEDNIPFLAGALSFDILLTAIPFVGLVLAVVGYLVQYQVAIHQLNVHELLERFLPESSGGEQGTFGFIERGLGDLVARRGHITLLAAPLFLWFSTRMFGGLRAALNEVFDTEENRPWPIAKLIDLAMVFVAGALFLANAFASSTPGFFSQLLSLVLSTLLFFVIFKFLPSRRIYWRTSVVASLFCAMAFEIAKRLYALYVARFVTFDRVASDANLIGFLLFILWIYYTAYMFLLGGEVAETYDLMRMRRLQRVRLG